MDRTITYVIEKQYEGMEIKDFLKVKKYSSGLISNQKHFEDGIMHNGKRAYVSEKLIQGDIVTINIHEPTCSEKIPPVYKDIDILYEDEDLIVVNKPSDMPVHPSLNNYENTLANALAYYYQNNGLKFVFRCMNRLDRNTSGTVLIAKNPLSGALLSKMIKERSIKKEYIAVVEGNIRNYIFENSKLENKKHENDYNNLENVDTFTIDANIARVDGSTILRKVDAVKGERAITHVTVLDVINEGKNSVVCCNLETGRTHQIRVHLSSIGYPLVGDGLYNEKYEDNVLHRHLLHCRKLEFIHPVTNVPLSIAAPFPEDMSFLKYLFNNSKN